MSELSVPFAPGVGESPYGSNTEVAPYTTQTM